MADSLEGRRGIPRSLLVRVVLVVVVTLAPTIKEWPRSSEAETAPTITKSTTNVSPNPDASVGYFDVTITVPEVMMIRVADAGATLLSSAPNTGACTVISTGWRCRVDSALVLRLSKPLSLATNAPHFCEAGTLSNSASMTADDGSDLGASNTVDLPVPANPDETCVVTRELTICKVVEDNGDSTADTATFGGAISGSSADTTWSTGSDVAEGGEPACVQRTVGEAESVTVTETTPGDWNASGYPRYFKGEGSCPGDAQLGAGATMSTGDSKVTICNKKPPATRPVTVCKSVLENDDGVPDAASFGGSVNPSAGTGGDWAVTDVAEGSSDCSDTVAVVAGATFHLSETLPVGWTNQDGYPQYFTGETGACDATHQLAADPAFGGDITKVTICNKREQATRSVTICSAVLENDDNVDDGGDFGGMLSPSAGASSAWSVTGVGEGSNDCDEQLAVVANATFTLSESSIPEAWTHADGFPRYVTNAATCSGGAPSLDDTVTFDVSVTTVTVCNQREPATGTIRITKLDLTAGHASWSFSVSGPTTIPGQQVAGGYPDGASTEIKGVVLNGTKYFVSEDGKDIVDECPADNTNPDLVRVTQLSGAAGIALTTPGQVAEFQFLNEPCDLASTLVVSVVADVNGNHEQDATEGKLTWPIRLTGPSHPSGEPFTIAGTRVFAGLIPGEYRLEAMDGSPGYRVVGVIVRDSPFTADESASVALAKDDTASVTFYNQPRVAVRVVKSQRIGHIDNPGAGWTFTLTGCGVGPLQQTTGGDGTAVFADLPPAAGCVYSVSETTRTGWTVVPAVAQAAIPTAAGETAELRFVNIRNLPPSPPPAAPSPSSGSPTAGGTGGPPGTPGPGNTPEPTPVAGTAVPPPDRLVVPKPPSVGSGRANGSTSPWVLAAITAASVAVIVFAARRKRI